MTRKRNSGHNNQWQRQQFEFIAVDLVYRIIFLGKANLIKMQCFNKIMNCQLFDTIWNGLAPLDPLFDKLEVLAPPGIEFDVGHKMK